ncbi:UNVERIFIED_CONTAM: hypothetical protein Sradi_2521800 [Sesamum radiatum]|uniref:Uncharacterized protein n=1 Tax=Sesamum radiatum TaxID=300843 RepID=A0AAW2SKG9_SESRA
MIQAAVWSVCGLNRGDHQQAVNMLVNKFHLHFIGILETRVTVANLTRVKVRLLQNWKWLIDYPVLGSRIWLAWNHAELDVEILDTGVQYVHCRITQRCLHESCYVTVIYSANDVIARRDLWTMLCDLSSCVVDLPWLVLGNFNAVLDMSEFKGPGSHGIIVVMEVVVLNKYYTPDVRSFGLGATREHSPIRFDNYLARSHGFLSKVANVWQNNIYGTMMYSVTRKLKLLKSVFRKMRKEKGDLATNVKLASEFLDIV